MVRPGPPRSDRCRLWTPLVTLALGPLDDGGFGGFAVTAPSGRKLPRRPKTLDKKQEYDAARTLTELKRADRFMRFSIAHGKKATIQALSEILVVCIRMK